MISLMIAGATRLIGRTQGYIGLAVRDVLIDCTVNGENTLCMETAWEPTPEEMFLLASGKPVIIRILGTQHPPIQVEVR